MINLIIIYIVAFLIALFGLYIGLKGGKPKHKHSALK